MARRLSRDPVKRRIGRPTALTDQVADAIIAAVERGNHITTACALAHVSRHSMYAWVNRANHVEAAINAGQDYDRHELRFLDFRNRLEEARALAEARAVSVVERSMAGGFLISEEPVVNDRGEVQRDDDGEILYKRTWSQPDGRLALSYLGRSRPDVWGQNPTQRLELVTSEPEVDDDGDAPARDHIEALSKRLAAVASARADEDPEGYGVDPDVPDRDGVYDAEVVEDEAG